MNRDSIDFGTVNIATLFRRLFIPTLLGMISISAVTAIDGIFVGHGVGSDGIAAVNICVPLMMIFTGLGLMAGVGCSVVVSIHAGRGQLRTARMNVTQALVAVSLITVAATALIMLYAPAIARALGSSPGLLPMAVEYMRWFMPSMVFQMWISVGLFVIRFDGAPKVAMWCSVVSAALNVVLDYIFIFPLGWGLRGAAFATALSCAAGGIMAMAYLLLFARTMRPGRVKLSVKSLRLSLRNIGYQCRIGSSAMLGELTMAMLMFMGNRTFMSHLGDDGVGAFGIACYYTPFVFMIGNAVAQSAQPIVSYNFGIGDHRRVTAAGRIALLTAAGCGLVSMSAFMLMPQAMVGLFLDTRLAAARIAIGGLPLFAAGFVFFTVNLTVIGYNQSLERTAPATVYALLRGFVFLAAAFAFMPALAGTAGIWLAMPVSELLTTVVIAGSYLWRRMRRAA